MRKKGKLYLFKLLILALMLFSYATSAYALTIDGSLQGNQLIWEIRTNQGLEFLSGSFFGQDVGPDLNCDPGFVNINQTTSDKASTTGVFKDENGDGALDLLVTSVNTAYPGYYNSVSMKVCNRSSQSIIMPQPVLRWMGQEIMVIDGAVITLCNQAGIPAVEFIWLNNTGKILAPGGRFEELLDFHILSTPSEPEISDLNGLTPGYWKNWRNHYNTDQFNLILKGTIAPDIAAADLIFKKYSAAPGKELTMLKAQLLAAQLTLNLTGMTGLPNPDRAYLNITGLVEWNGGKITVGDAVGRALEILAKPELFSRQQILDEIALLDKINNL